MTTARARHAGLVCAALVAVLAACTNADIQPPPQSQEIGDPKDYRMRQRYGTLFGEDTFLFSTSRRRSDEAAGSAGIGVNAFLWRATLETLDFVPLASADPFGGLIITEWYQPQDAPEERFKLQVLIRDTVLRADAIKVAVFRQVRGPDGNWLDAPVTPTTASAIEDKILTRARELRIASLPARR